jgi:hypothetical protein
MKGTINYLEGVSVNLLVSMKISKGQITTFFDTLLETSELTVTPPT